jgi:hypothetical protein
MRKYDTPCRRVSSDHQARGEATTKQKRQWQPLPGFTEYEVSDQGELRGAKTKNILSQKHEETAQRTRTAAALGEIRRAMREEADREEAERRRANDLVQAELRNSPIGRLLRRW